MDKSQCPSLNPPGFKPLLALTSLLPPVFLAILLARFEYFRILLSHRHAECQHHVLSFLPLLPGLKDKYRKERNRQDMNTYIGTFSEAGWVAKWEEC